MNADSTPPRQLTPKELQEILDLHCSWLESGGEYGEQANLSGTKLPPNFTLAGADLRKAHLAGAHLQEADLRRARLEGADLQGAHLERAILEDADLAHANLQGSHLTQAQLRGADLLESYFCGATLEGADLRATTGLLAPQLAGTTLRRATLPESILNTEHRVFLERVSRSAQTLFFVMLGACMFALINIERFGYAQLLANSASLRLPFVESEIQIAWLYWLGPLFLCGAYVYFHLHVLPLWQGLAELPTVFPDGRTAQQSVYLWLLGAFLQGHVRRGRQNRSSLSLLQQAIFVVLAWCLVPATLCWFWLRYLPLHQWSGTIWHIILVLGAIVFGVVVHSMAAATLHREELPSCFSFLRRSALRDWRLYAVAMAPMVLGVVSFGAIYGVPPDRFADVKYGTSRPSPPDLDRIDPRRWVPIVLHFPAQGDFNCCSPFLDLTHEDFSVRHAT